MARGYLELFRKWNYVLSYEYKGFDQTSSEDWNVTDARISTDVGPQLGTFTFGKMKEPFAYEMVGDAANLPQQERLLSPFFRSRNVGAQLSNAVLDQRATWTVGWYNDWWVAGQSWSDSGNDFAGRITALPLWSDDGATYLHLAASARYYGAAGDQLRYGAVDLNDKGAQGGRMDGWWAGVNWWATRRWKASITYGDIDLDRNGITGNTRTWLSRIQWIY
jgi:phosphate-selective porin